MSTSESLPELESICTTAGHEPHVIDHENPPHILGLKDGEWILLEADSGLA